MINETVTGKIGNEYRKWTRDELIILNCAMGRGKTYFITNVLGKYAKTHGKKILYLCNRSKLSEEVFASAKESRLKGVMTIRTYQSIQKDIDKGNKIPDVDYIICDEIHYIFSDGFNDKTDVMYKWLKDEKFAIKVFMSATGHNIFPCIKRWGDYKEYVLEPDYSYIKKVVFYDNVQHVKNVINGLKDDEKLLYFSRKISDAYELHTQYEESSFVCSKAQSEYKDKITDDAIIVKDNNPTLKNQVTFTTSVWDNGINIKDNNLKHIVCDFEDLVTLIQAIGRKRVGKIVEGSFVLSDEDSITLHIMNYAKIQLNRFANTKRAIINEVNKYINNDKEWMQEQKEKRSKHINCCLYVDYTSGKIEMNYARYLGIEKELNRLKHGMKHGFDNHILDGLGNSFIGEVEYVSIEENNKKSNLEKFMEYLNSKVATRLFKEDQDELKSEFNKAGLNVDGGRTMGMKTMNAFMEDNDVPFRIESSRVKVDGKLHTIWTVLQ